MRALASALVGVVAALAVATPAQAVEDVPPMHIDATVVCILPQSPVMGSGWKLQRAVTLWNEAQDVVDLRVYGDPSCEAYVKWTRYDSRTPAPDSFEQAQGWCGWTDWVGASLTQGTGGQVWLYDTANVWMNDACLNATKATRKYFLTHELGHALGLPHAFEDPTSVMCYCNDYQQYKGRPSASDVARLQALFALDPGVYTTP